MSKETYYFPHDYEPTSDPKMSAMIGVYGAVGYGLYWRIIEMLHSDELHKLPLKQYIFIGLSKQMLTGVEQCSTMFPPVETVQRFVEDCIKIFELFVSDGEYFYSHRVNRNITRRENEKINKSNAGKASAEKRKLKNSTPVEQPSTPVEQNPTKERKGKENKEKEIGEMSTPQFDSTIMIMTDEQLEGVFSGEMRIDTWCMNLRADKDQFKNFLKDWVARKKISQNYIYSANRLIDFMLKDWDIFRKDPANKPSQKVKEYKPKFDYPENYGKVN